MPTERVIARRVSLPPCCSRLILAGQEGPWDVSAVALHSQMSDTLRSGSHLRSLPTIQPPSLCLSPPEAPRPCVCAQTFATVHFTRTSSGETTGTWGGFRGPACSVLCGESRLCNHCRPQLQTCCHSNNILFSKVRKTPLSQNQSANKRVKRSGLRAVGRPAGWDLYTGGLSGTSKASLLAETYSEKVMFSP